ncbi:MAG: pseudouridine synthase [bacterium]
MRLAKYLASCGLGSRRSCEDIIRAGGVELNGRLVTKVESDIDIKNDKVLYEGERIVPEKLVYYLLNKPVGYTSTRQDIHAKLLISDLVPKNPPIWPVGRLDRETSGLIILTNDGELTQKLTHPKFVREKEYIINTDSILNKNEIESIQTGVVLDDGLIRPDLFEKSKDDSYRIIIHEGRKRIIRRLIAHFGKKVIRLKRVRIDSLELSDLKDGEYKILSDREISLLKNQ